MKNVAGTTKKALIGLTSAVFGIALSLGAHAADPMYKSQKAQAEADYDTAKARCDALNGNDKDVCIKEAKAAKTRTEADAKVQHETNAAKADAREDKLKADYKAAKEKCDAMSGDQKDACQERAKAQYHQ